MTPAVSDLDDEDVASSSPSSPSKPDIPRFTSIVELGKGTFGKVWKAYDNKLKKKVAVKQYNELNCGNWGFSTSALREISFLKFLQHKHLANLIDIVYDNPTSDSCLLLVMELEDTDLNKWLCKHQGKIQINQCQRISYQILLGCDYLHSRRVMHRDIKPDNILMNESTGIVKITDLGASRLHDRSQRCKYTSPVQALWYRAPEVLLGDIYGESIDLWSIG